MMASGRSSSCGWPTGVGSSSIELVVKDPCVSRKHCRIELVNFRVMVHDFESTNGTFVNGMRVATGELRSGATITVGSTRIRVVTDADQTQLLGTAASMRKLRDDITRLARSRLSVLILGETGTGKELVALAIHQESERRGEFVPLNCGSIPKELVESELFGHERGAFTGASSKRVGVFQEADGGTLFLDEVAELPLAQQTRLLRVLETGMVRPVGSNREVAVNVRVVAATHVNLREAMLANRFRADLYYRLVGAEIATPPLRVRLDDVPMLAQRFLDEFSPQAGFCKLSVGALQALRLHQWPGNVRELRHVLQRAVALSENGVIEEEDLVLRAGLQNNEVLVRVDGRVYREIERDILHSMIRRHQGNQRAAADALEIPKSTMCDKVKRYRIGISE